MLAKAEETVAAVKAKVGTASKAELEGAMKAAQDALSNARDAKDAKMEVLALCTVAKAHMVADDHVEAMEVAQQATTLAIQGSDKFGEASALTAYANALSAGLMYPSEAVAAAKEALSIFQQLNDAAAQTAAEEALQRAYTNIYGAQDALTMVTKDKLSHFRKTGDKPGQAASLETLADAHFQKWWRNKDEDKDNVRLAQEAVTMYSDLGNNDGQVSALKTLAVAQIEVKSYADAVQSAKEAQTICNGAGDKKGEAAALQLIYGAHHQAGRYDDEINVAKEARELCHGIDDKEGEASASHAIGLAYIEKDSPDLALASLKEAVPLYQATCNKAGEAYSLQSLLQASLLKKKRSAADQKDAMTTARKAFLLFRDLDQVKGQAMVLSNIATLAMSPEGDTEAALRAAQQSGLAKQILGEQTEELLVNVKDPGAEFAVQAALQAGALARKAGDLRTEAESMYTIAFVFISAGAPEAGRALAMKSHTAFQQAGFKKGVDASKKLIDSLKNKLAVPRPKPMISYTPPSMDGRPRGDLMSDTAQTVIWSKAFGETPYIEYLLELLSFVNEIIKAASKTKMILATRGVNARESGEQMAPRFQDITGNTVWAALRTIRLEMPRLHIHSVDVPPHATGPEISEIFSCVQSHNDMASEVTFKIDRSSK